MTEGTSLDPIEGILARQQACRESNDAEIQRLRRLIDRHERRIEGLPRFNSGTALREIADLISDATGLNVRISGPFGLCGEYGMTVEERADVTAAFLKFRPSGEGVMIEMIDLDSHKGTILSDARAKRIGTASRCRPWNGCSKSSRSSGPKDASCA